MKLPEISNINQTTPVPYYFGIHAVDRAGNVGYDDGAKPVTVKSDPSKPKVNYFSVSSPTIVRDETVKIKYIVSDLGGSGLKQVELWVGRSKSNLSEKITRPIGGNSATGEFKWTPAEAGDYYFGIHVVDNADNVGYDDGAKLVKVTLDTVKPTIIDFSVSEEPIIKGQPITISYIVKDSGGSRLKQVELWKGKSKSNLTRINHHDLKGDGPISGRFIHTPENLGTFYFGIHVLDHHDNLTCDDGARPVTVNADNTKPEILEFSVSPNPILKGEPVTISYSVQDTGGSHLKQVELWKGPSKSQLTHIETKQLSGDGPVKGSFTHTPSSLGISYFGIHVVDNYGNVTCDTGAIPVMVNADTNKPEIIEFTVTPTTVHWGDDITISYTVRDSGGSHLKQVELWKGVKRSSLEPVKVNPLSGDGPIKGSFQLTTRELGLGLGYSFLGIHVLDNYGNVTSDNGAIPINIIEPIKRGPLESNFKTVSLDRGDRNTSPEINQIHRGVDITAENGKPVYPITKGVVVENHKAQIGNNDHWNAALIIRHDLPGGYVYTYYGHITSDLKKDDKVDPDKSIGTINLGHLHISVNNNQTVYWGYHPTSHNKSCADIKNNGWKRFQDVFDLHQYKKANGQVGCP